MTNNLPTKKVKSSSSIVEVALRICGLYVTLLGVFLFVLMLISFFQPEYVLKLLLGKMKTSFKLAAGSSWAQVAVAFGMHSFADVNAGLAMMNVGSSSSTTLLPRLSPQVTVWNTSRFVISFLWMLKITHGLFHMTLNKTLDMNLTPLAITLLVSLGIDAILIRPIAVYMQRLHNDCYTIEKYSELKEYQSLSFIQKACRFVFYYESVLSGCSGAAYFMFPELFYYLYGYPTSESDPITLWCFSQFGVLVMIFGMYQMSCEIDQNRMMVLWWLILDIVWLYIYWQGTTVLLGSWNPLTFTGANFWCHSAWHADSTLALARIVYLMTPSSAHKGTQSTLKTKER